MGGNMGNMGIMGNMGVVGTLTLAQKPKFKKNCRTAEIMVKSATKKNLISFMEKKTYG